MNYQRHYNLLIEKHGLKSKPNGYSERHHIVPRCLGGSDDESNLIYLSAEAHYVAHQLLVKMNPGNPKLVYAAWAMTCSKKDNIRSNKAYSWIRKQYSKNHPMKSSELKEVMRKHGVRRGSLNNTPESIEKARLANIGKKRTEEVKRKMSESKLGFKHPMYGKRGENSPVFGCKNGLYGVKGKNHHCYGSRWINNGNMEKKVKIQGELEAGFIFGRLTKMKGK